jgi:choice-of-anchor C domain-containing protein
MRVAKTVVSSTAIAAALVMSVAFGAGTANAITVNNPGFDSFDPLSTVNPASNTFTSLPGGSTAIDGWTVGGDGVDYMGSTYWQASPQGGRNVDLNASPGVGSISQQLFGFDTGHLYTVRFWLAGNPEGGPDQKDGTVTAFADGHDFHFNVSGRDKDHMGWTQVSFNFIADNDNTLLIFASGTGSGAPANCPCYGPAIDGVEVFANDTAAPAPIPAALPLFAGGLGVLGLLARRRQKKAAMAAA